MERTWWIVNSGNEPRIEHAHQGSWVLTFFRKVGCGPFWSAIEAARFLGHWTK